VSVRLSLLALLDQGSCYGYQLRTELEWRTGSARPVNVGQIYNTLDRLERDKLVRKTGENNYYEITELGSTQVDAWFTSASPAAELPAKLALASTLPGVDLAAVIRAQRDAAVRQQSTTVAPTTVAELAAAIVGVSDDAATESELALLRGVEKLMARGITPLGLSEDVPKRGRPAKTSA
jgi:DNA-binding PadR family transcriptional regulator